VVRSESRLKFRRNSKNPIQQFYGIAIIFGTALSQIRTGAHTDPPHHNNPSNRRNSTRLEALSGLSTNPHPRCSGPAESAGWPSSPAESLLGVSSARQAREREICQERFARPRWRRWAGRRSTRAGCRNRPGANVGILYASAENLASLLPSKSIPVNPERCPIKVSVR